MAFRFSQFPNGAFPLNSKPLLSFVAGITVGPIPPVPPPDNGFGGGGRGDYWAQQKRTMERIDADDFEAITAMFVVAARQVWRN